MPATSDLLTAIFETFNDKATRDPNLPQSIKHLIRQVYSDETVDGFDKWYIFKVVAEQLNKTQHQDLLLATPLEQDKPTQPENKHNKINRNVIKTEPFQKAHKNLLKKTNPNNLTLYLKIIAAIIQKPITDTALNYLFDNFANENSEILKKLMDTNKELLKIRDLDKKSPEKIFIDQLKEIVLNKSDEDSDDKTESASTSATSPLPSPTIIPDKTEQNRQLLAAQQDLDNKRSLYEKITEIHKEIQQQLTDAKSLGLDPHNLHTNFSIITLPRSQDIPKLTADQILPLAKKLNGISENITMLIKEKFDPILARAKENHQVINNSSDLNDDEKESYLKNYPDLESLTSVSDIEQKIKIIQEQNELLKKIRQKQEEKQAEEKKKQAEEQKKQKEEQKKQAEEKKKQQLAQERKAMEEEAETKAKITESQKTLTEQIASLNSSLGTVKDKLRTQLKMKVTLKKKNIDSFYAALENKNDIDTIIKLKNDYWLKKPILKWLTVLDYFETKVAQRDATIDLISSAVNLQSELSKYTSEASTENTLHYPNVKNITNYKEAVNKIRMLKTKFKDKTDLFNLENNIAAAETEIEKAITLLTKKPNDASQAPKPQLTESQVTTYSSTTKSLTETTRIKLVSEENLNSLRGLPSLSSSVSATQQKLGELKICAEHAAIIDSLPSSQNTIN